MVRSRGCVTLPPYPPLPCVASTVEAAVRARGFWIQYKFDDVRTLIELDPAGALRLWNRHREPLRAYRISQRLRDAIFGLRLAPGMRHVLDGGFLRGVPALAGERPLILWDILILDGRYLLGSTYGERFQKLTDLSGHPDQVEKYTRLGVAYVVEGPLWLARNLEIGVAEALIRARSSRYTEGVVLKNFSGRLERALGPDNNGSWMIKVRNIPDQRQRNGGIGS